MYMKLILLCIIQVACHLGLCSKIYEGAIHSKYFQYLMVLHKEHVYYTYTLVHVICTYDVINDHM